MSDEPETPEDDDQDANESEHEEISGSNINPIYPAETEPVHSPIWIPRHGQ